MIPKSRFGAAAYLASMFILGAVFGGFAYRLYSVKTVTATTPHRPTPAEFRQRYIDEIRSHVKLDDQQVTRLNEILDETKASFDQMNSRRKQEGQAIQNAQIDKINAMLRDDQKPLYTEFRAEREKRRKALNKDRR